MPIIPMILNKTVGLRNAGERRFINQSDGPVSLV